MSRAVMQQAFEAWYCADAARQGVDLSEGIEDLREGDGYGDRFMLNGKWQGWQAALAQPEQETGIKGYAMALNEVALKLRKRYEHDLLSTPLWAEFEKSRNRLARSIAAPQRQPLTDAEIDKIVDAHTTDDEGYDIWCNGQGVARATEAAHGIKAAS